MTMLLTLVERQLRHSEALLGELDSPLANDARAKVHRALMNVQTLQRLDEVESIAARDAA